MYWTFGLIFILLLCLTVIAVVLWLFWRDRKLERASLEEVISPQVRAELEQEFEEALQRKSRFEKALQEAEQSILGDND